MNKARKVSLQRAYQHKCSFARRKKMMISLSKFEIPRCFQRGSFIYEMINLNNLVIFYKILIFGFNIENLWWIGIIMVSTKVKVDFSETISIIFWWTIVSDNDGLICSGFCTKDTKIEVMMLKTPKRNTLYKLDKLKKQLSIERRSFSIWKVKID